MACVVVVDEYKIPCSRETTISGLRRNMMACVAFPTCPLAFAEAERYLPTRDADSYPLAKETCAGDGGGGCGGGGAKKEYPRHFLAK